jgi:hypothetical protein
MTPSVSLNGPACKDRRSSFLAWQMPGMFQGQLDEHWL